MGLFIGDVEPSKIFLGDTPISKVFLGDTQIRPTTVPGLCFTAEDAGATIALSKYGSPTSVTIETSTNGGSTWSTYTFGTTITLASVGDKVLFRNTSSTTTNFSKGTIDYYEFTITGGKAGCSGDITYLLNKNGGVDTIPNNYCFYNLFYEETNLTTPPELPSTTLKSYCYNNMFYKCASLTVAPSLPATTLGTYCYSNMFRLCTSLTTIPKLPAITMKNYCYQNMFTACSLIKLSATQTGDYQTEYRIPTSGTGSTATSWNTSMFSNTGGTFTGKPTINTTYYTSNTVV